VTITIGLVVGLLYVLLALQYRVLSSRISALKDALVKHELEFTHFSRRTGVLCTDDEFREKVKEIIKDQNTMWYRHGEDELKWITYYELFRIITEHMGVEVKYEEGTEGRFVLKPKEEEE